MTYQSNYNMVNMGYIIKYGLVSIQSLCISYEAFMVNVFLTSYLFFESFSILDSPKYFLPFWSSQYTSDLFEFELRYPTSGQGISKLALQHHKCSTLQRLRSSNPFILELPRAQHVPISSGVSSFAERLDRNLMDVAGFAEMLF